MMNTPQEHTPNPGLTQDYQPDAPASEQATLAPTDESVPLAPIKDQRFGDYELLEEIARGGMGVVFKARQVSLNRLVALKMILAGKLAGADELARFRAEAEAAANLDHPNIVPIHEVGEFQGQPYFSMKFVEGGTLTSLLSRAPGERPHPHDLVPLLIAVARAVHHAHQRGILHRDLKPGNVLLQRKNEESRMPNENQYSTFIIPMVTDFGLAKKVEGDSGMTRTGAIVGTPSYMAPEQAAARKALTTAVDVYSLGAILYEMLTGKPPFLAETPLDTLMQVLDREPDPPSRFNPQVDRDLSVIAMRCLEKEPGRRYESAAALADDLERWQHGEPIAARPVGRVDRAWRWCRRNALVASLILATATALLTGSILSLLFALEAHHQRGKAEHEAGEARKSAAESAQMLGEALLARARAARVAGERAQAWDTMEILAQVRSRPDEQVLRQETIHIIATPGFKRIAKLGPTQTKFAGYGKYFRFSADGRYLAAADSWIHGGPPQRTETGIVVYECATEKVVGRWPCQYYDFTWHPRQPLLAVTRQEPQGWRAMLWDPVADRVTEQMPGRVPLQFSPSGNRLAMCDASSDEARVWDRGTQAFLPFRTPAKAVAFLNEQELVVRSFDGARHEDQVGVWNVQTGKELLGSDPALAMARKLELLQLSEDGHFAALASRTQPKTHLEIWRLAGDFPSTRQHLGDLPRPTGKAPEPLWFNTLPNQLALVEPPEFQTVVLRDLLLPQAMVTGRLVKPGMWGSVMTGGAFSPDGSFLAAVDTDSGPANVRLWELSSGKLLATLYDQRNPVWSPDGRYLAVYGTDAPSLTALSDSHIWVYEVAPPTPNAQVDRTVNALTFDRTGKQVLGPAAAWALSTQFGRPLLIQTMVYMYPEQQFLARNGTVWSIEGVYQFHQERQQHGIRDLKLRQYFPVHAPNLPRTLPRSLAEIGGLSSAALTADGKRLVIVWDAQQREDIKPGGAWRLLNRGLLEVWDLETMQCVKRWEDIFRTGNIVVQAVSPDGKSGVIGDSKGLRRWSLEDGSFSEVCEFSEQIAPGHFKQHTPKALLYSPDGARVYCGLDNNTIRVVDWHFKETLATLKGHTGEVLALAVTPDGRTLASGGWDKTIRLWDAGMGQELARWTAHEATVSALAWQPDGQILASGDKAGAIKIWDVPRIRGELRKLGLDWRE